MLEHNVKFKPLAWPKVNMKTREDSIIIETYHVLNTTNRYIIAKVYYGLKESN